MGLYFTAVIAITTLSLVSVFYPYPPWLLERIQGTWEWSDMPTPRLLHCLKIIFITFLVHCLIHFICRCCFRTFFERYYTLPFPERITLSEKVLSSIHGFVLGTSALNLLLVQQVWSGNVFGRFPVILDYLFCFSAGYELYDLGTMILQDYYNDDPKLKNENVFWIHHSSMLFGYTIAMFKRKMGFAAVVMMVTELTVLPSNAHWYFKAFFHRDTRAFHFNQGLRLWCFVWLRLFTAPMVLVAFIMNIDQFWYEEDAITKTTAVIILVLLGIMNVTWTNQMISLYRKRVRLQDKRRMALEAAQQANKTKKQS